MAPSHKLVRRITPEAAAEGRFGAMSGSEEDNDGGRCGLAWIMNGVWRYHPQERALKRVGENTKGPFQFAWSCCVSELMSVCARPPPASPCLIQKDDAKEGILENLQEEDRPRLLPSEHPRASQHAWPGAGSRQVSAELKMGADEHPVNRVGSLTEESRLRAAVGRRGKQGKGLLSGEARPFAS